MEFYFKEGIDIKLFFIKSKWNLIIATGILLFFSLFFAMIVTVLNKGDTYRVNNVLYTGEVYPAENSRSMVLGTFQDENGDRFKLFINKDKVDLLEKDSHYNITYLMNTASYPNDNILSEWSVSSAEKKPTTK